VERGMGSSQPGEGGLVHPQATYISPKLFLLLACLKRGQIDNKQRSKLIKDVRGTKKEIHRLIRMISLLYCPF
jgi:hypothetical protein